jgi:hypothetical protein
MPSAVRRCAVIGLGAVALGSGAPAFAQETLRHALVIGANDGGGVLEPLRYAERDAEAFAKVLVELGGFPEERVTVLYQPDSETLQAALAHHAALADVAPDDLFVFYYSGHADGNGLRLSDDLYWFDALKHDLRLIESTARLGLLDACRSGSITRLKGAKVAPSLFGGQEKLATEGEIWMTATSAEEAAQESEQLRGGFFTHYLVSGLRGAADTGDGLVDVDELYRYTYDRVVERTSQAGAIQRPHFDRDTSGAQGLALTDVRRSDSALILDGGGPGHITVARLADRVQMAEVDVLEGRDVRIALPSGRYIVRRRWGPDLFEAQVALTPNSALELTSWRKAGLESTVARGEALPGAEGFHESVRHYRELSEAFVADLNLDESPAVAGTMSLLAPGGGQLYNNQRTKAVLFFLGTAFLVGGGTLFSVSDEDLGAGDAAATLGFSLWGASIADAVYNVKRSEELRPRTGGAVGWTTGFSEYRRTHTGLLAEITPVPNLSIGIDRTGYSWYPEGGWDVALGSRLTAAIEGKRVRPGIFAAYGVRVGQATKEDPVAVRGVLGGGVVVRYYTVPRYFIEFDLRIEQDGDVPAGVAGLGFGVHLGGR